MNISTQNGVLRQSRSLTLLLFDGFSYRDMAATLGITESHVGVKINRIKTRLTKLTKEEHNHGL